MTISGELLIGSSRRLGAGDPIRAINPATGRELEPPFPGGGREDVGQACALAWEAFDRFRALPLEARARFLETIGQNILELGDALVERCVAESGLPRARIESERGRTVNQLRLFAGVVREGTFLDARIDPAMPERQPLPRVDLRLRNVPVGPVAVFGASNFPLAFSVAGGDTASAFAAGCPVVVKAHAAHPGTSELIGRAIQKAVTDCDLPEGVFSLIFGPVAQVGQALVADKRIKAVGFTGSRAGGTALMRITAERPEPIPVYAEMSSINPVILMDGALSERAEAIAEAFVASLSLGAGQFCTNPGLVIAIEGAGLERFLDAARGTLSQVAPATMLTSAIHEAYTAGVERLALHPCLREVARGPAGEGYQGSAALFTATAEDFLLHPTLREEVFGAAGIVISCKNASTVRQVLEGLEGQLTAALHLSDADHDDARRLLPTLERRAGRILVNGFGTGVEVSHAMVHGGPYPATSDGRSTSVGSLAIRRFLRPVCYQDMPAALLPPELEDANPLGLWRQVDGALASPA